MPESFPRFLGQTIATPRFLQGTVRTPAKCPGDSFQTELHRTETTPPAQPEPGLEQLATQAPGPKSRQWTTTAGCFLFPPWLSQTLTKERTPVGFGLTGLSLDTRAVPLYGFQTPPRSPLRHRATP